MLYRTLGLSIISALVVYFFHYDLDRKSPRASPLVAKAVLGPKFDCGQPRAIFTSSLFLSQLIIISFPDCCHVVFRSITFSRRLYSAPRSLAEK